jgi:hypothetical protein
LSRISNLFSIFQNAPRIKWRDPFREFRLAMISEISSSSMMDYLTPYRAGMAAPRAGRNARGSAAEGEEGEENAFGVTPGSGRNAAGSAAKGAEGKTSGVAGELSEEEMRLVEELAKTDRRVRQHEQAHMAVGGSLVTSGASYEYETGPDGKRYAVGGEVGISLAKGRTPEETLQRARRIRAAALAPADPSPQDRSIAAAAGQMEMQAMREIAAERMEESKQGDDTAASPVPAAGAEEGTGASAGAAYFAGIQAYRQMAGMPEPGTGLGVGEGMGSLLSVFA